MRCIWDYHIELYIYDTDLQSYIAYIQYYVNYIHTIGHYRWTRTLGRFWYVSIHCPFKGHPSRCRYKASGSAARGPRDSGRLRGAVAMRRKMSCAAVPARLSRPRSCEAIAWYHVLSQCFHHIPSCHRSFFYMVACIQISKWIKRRQLKVETYSKLSSTCFCLVRRDYWEDPDLTGCSWFAGSTYWK